MVNIQILSLSFLSLLWLSPFIFKFRYLNIVADILALTETMTKNFKTFLKRFN